MQINHPNPTRLLDQIMNRIILERTRLNAVRIFALVSIICTASLGLCGLAATSLAKEFSSSGFMQYATLVFIDVRAVLANWQDFSLSLLESFPTINAIGLIGTIVAILISSKLALTYGKQLLALKKIKAV